MSFNFENYLLQELNNDKIVVLKEQLFAKNGEFDPNKIYVVVKYLTSSIEYGAETQPVQLLVLSEQNGLQEAKEIFDTYTQTHNWLSGKFGNTFVKQQYSSPVVMSNFNEAAYGYRSVLYVSATLFLLNNLMDITDLKVKIDASNVANYDPLETYNIGDLAKHEGYVYTCNTDGTTGAWDEHKWDQKSTVDLNPMSASIGYTMSGDTQPFNSGYAKTEKNFATFVMTINIACISNPFLNECVKIMNLSTTKKGNETFTFYFKIGEIQFNSFEMKMTGCSLTTAVNDIPSLQLSFSV